MREVWANGERYRSYHAFLKAIGVEPTRIRSMQDAVADAIRTGRPIWHGGKSYELSGSKPAPRLEAGPVERKPSGLLASGYSTFGLHQDKGGGTMQDELFDLAPPQDTHAEKFRAYNLAHPEIYWAIRAKEYVK